MANVLQGSSARQWTPGWWYAAGTALAVAAAVLLVLVNLSVGFLGSEDNPANRVFLGVIGTAMLGAAVARLQASGMAKAMAVAAGVQCLTGVAAVFGGWGAAGWKGIYEVFLGTILFGGLWLLSAWLFRRAAGARGA